MYYACNFTEAHELLAEINAAASAVENNTGYVSLANFHRAVVMVIPGTLGSALDVDVEQLPPRTAGAGAKAFGATAGDHDITVALADTLRASSKSRPKNLTWMAGLTASTSKSRPPLRQPLSCWCGASARALRRLALPCWIA